ncbi:hypothetical protein OCU04_003296 [Sclerotinia nivalis]|uniref:RBR-type E3 ubiquitin transferase n=1 Tax=Sclerotinia nivalis TaxID=352851 RepID=A0A9X0AS12_9HELO|nr:hypothetical protein OCU04_003296 [Sclerotinia nivalis]
MGRKARATKSPIKADKPAVPQTIFSLPPTAYDIPLAKHILSIFHQQNTFKKRESRTSLLHKLAQIEQTLPKNEQEAATQLLRHDMPITRAAIKAGPQKEDGDGKFLGMSEGQDLECEICLEVLPSKTFPQSVAANKCEHTTHICTMCLKRAITTNVKSNPWDNIPCPFSTCKNMLEPKIVRKYIRGKLLKNYNNYIDMLEIRNLSNFRWCLNVGCEAGQVHEGGFDELRVICHACKSESCFRHQVPLGRGIMRFKACKDVMDNTELPGTKQCPSCKVPTIMNPIGCGRAKCRCGYHWKNFKTPH